MRRFLLLAAVVGTQLATGCYCTGPVFPRLHTGFGCGTGQCGTPILNRPLLNRPILAPYTGVPTYPIGTPYTGEPGYAVPVGQPHGDFGAPSGGCVGCGASAGAVSGYPGYPLAVPGHSAPPPFAVTPAPMPMPSAMVGGVPHDSALLKMPTIMPPGPSKSQRPEELARELTGRR